MYISPPTTIPINITGKKITVQSNFIIPQDALNPKTKNFPTNQIIQIANNNDNIFLLLLKLILICVFHFFCSFSAKYSDVFFMHYLEEMVVTNSAFFYQIVPLQKQIYSCRNSPNFLNHSHTMVRNMHFIFL